MTETATLKRSPLAGLHRARGARMMVYQGWEIPAAFRGVALEYAMLQDGVALIDLSYRGMLRITGRDRRTWLQGLITQDVVALPDGRGAYAAILNPQGQMLSDMRVFALPDMLLCDVPAATAGFVPEYLDRFLFAEKAEIQDVSDELALLSLQGQQACLAIGAAFGLEWVELPTWGVSVEEWDGTPVIIARAPHCGEDGFDMFVPAERAAALYACLAAHAPQFGFRTVGWQAFNLRRIEAGVPWWGHELDNKTVPYEARLQSAVSTRKGCYVGQEIIARLEARGQVNNLLCGFTLEGDRVPEPGEEIHAGGKKAGRVTSAVRSFQLERVIALGYLRREQSQPGTAVVVRHGDGEQAATVAGLPFVPNDAG